MSNTEHNPRILWDGERIRAERERAKREAKEQKEGRFITTSLVMMVGISAVAALLGLAAFSEPENATGYVIGAFLISVYVVSGVWLAIMRRDKQEGGV